MTVDNFYFAPHLDQTFLNWCVVTSNYPRVAGVPGKLNLSTLTSINFKIFTRSNTENVE